MGTTLPTASSVTSFTPLTERFLRVLAGRNRSPHTVAAYGRDLGQFFGWLAVSHPAVADVGQVEKPHLNDYLAHLATLHVSGTSRARKLAAIREFFRELVDEGAISSAPTTGIPTPKKERRVQPFLTQAEYNRLLSEATTNPKALAILQLFLQTGIRVSELCDLRLGDVDLAGRTLKVRGKGQVERVIELERKGQAALKQWLAVRPHTTDDHLFLNPAGEALGERGVKKLVATYRHRAGISKPVGPHALRRTFATAKAQQGVDVYQLKEWMGHANINTTMGYVHRAKSPTAQKVMEDTSL